MRKFLTALVIIPLGLIFIVFAVANRHLVTVSFDPFNSINPSISVTLPLFLILIMVAVVGVAVGGSATWFQQRRWRRAARRHEAEAQAARAQLADLRNGSLGPSVPARYEPPQMVSYGVSGRDKQGATL